MLWGPHLAGSSSCRSGRLCSYRPEEAWRPLHRGVSSSVEQDVGVARHHLTLIHHCHGAVIKETPACGEGGVRKERLATEQQTRTREKCNTSEGQCQLQKIGIKLSDCTLTNVTALAVLVTWQASIGCVVASNHSSVVIDDCIQVVDGRLLHLILLPDTELTQIQIPTTHYIRGLAMEMGTQSTQRGFIIENLFCM